MQLQEAGMEMSGCPFPMHDGHQIREFDDEGLSEVSLGGGPEEGGGGKGEEEEEEMTFHSSHAKTFAKATGGGEASQKNAVQQTTQGSAVTASYSSPAISAASIFNSFFSSTSSKEKKRQPSPPPVSTTTTITMMKDDEMMGNGDVDVRTALRHYLSLGNFHSVMEWILVLTACNLLFSISCIFAEKSGWFIGYNKFTFDSAGLQLNLMDINVGWDRFSVSVNGASSMTTRFLDDISPIGYAFGIISFLSHLFSIILSIATLMLFYSILVHGHVRPFIGGKYVYMRQLSYCMIISSLLMMVFTMIALPACVRHDFNKAFAHQPGLYGFQVRAIWAYGLSVMVCFTTLFNGVMLGRKSALIDRMMEKKLGSTTTNTLGGDSQV